MTNFQDDRNIRVFISSTFRDMQDERDELMKKTFPVLRRKAAERDVTLTELDLRWGITPEESQSGKVVEICLREIENSEPFFVGIIGNRYGWIPSADDLGESLRERFMQVDGYVERRLSVTEMEMQFGVLERPEDMHAYFFIKEQEEDDVDEPQKLAALKNAVRTNGRYPVSTYSSPEDLAQQVEEAFTKLLDELFPEGALSELEKERIGQRSYLNNLCKNYIRTDANFAAIDDWMSDWEKHQLVITGASGLGKSALVANWVKEKLTIGDSLPYRIIYHFVGNGGSMGSHSHILKVLCDEIKDLYGFTVDEKENKADNEALEWLFYKVNADGDKPLLIVFNAINQIIETKDSSGINSKRLIWLPDAPRNIKILFTTLQNDDTMQVFQERHYPVFKLKPLTKEQREEMICNYLHIFSKKLQPNQIERIVADEQCENTLVLKTLLDELVNFGIYEKLDEKIEMYLGATSVEDFYAVILKGYENDFGETFVKHILSLIAVSRNGLSEEEILAITHETPLHWSQFFCSIRQHLIVKNGLISFAHSYIRKAVEDRYLTGQDDWEKACRKEIVNLLKDIESHRSMDELPFQLDQLNDTSSLHDYLLDLKVFNYVKHVDESVLGYYWRKITNAGFSLKDYLPLVDKIPIENRSSILSELCHFSRSTMGDPALSLLFIEPALAVAQDDEVKASILTDAGIVYADLNNPQKEIECKLESLTLNIRLFGENSIAVSTAYNNLGLAYEVHGDYQKALEYLTKSINLHRKLSGDNPNLGLATQYSNLGSIYGKLKNYKTALDFQIKALDIRRRILGDEHPDVAYSYNNVGNKYTDLGDYQKGLEYLSKALEIFQKAYGNNHPTIASVLNNLGATYSDLGNNQKALEYVLKSLSIRKQLFGETHSDTAVSYDNVGQIYSGMKDYQNALKYRLKALEIFWGKYGGNHLEVATSYVNVGSDYGHLGNYQKDLEYQLKALNIRLNRLGYNNADVAISYNNIGMSYMNLGNKQKALEYVLKAQDIYLNLYGKSHPDLAAFYSNLGSIYDSLGNSQKAIDNYHSSLSIYQSLCGDYQSELTLIFNAIGNIHYKCGDYPHAIEFLTKALSIQHNVLGDCDLEVADYYFKIGSIYNLMKDYSNALLYLSKALEIRLKIKNVDYSVIAESYNNIGCVYENLGDHHQAIDYMIKALDIYNRGPKDDLSALSSISNIDNYIGCVYSMIGNHQKALDYSQKALEIRLNLFGETHPYIATSYSNVGYSYSNLGNHQKALDYLFKAYHIYRQLPGDNLSSLSSVLHSIGYSYTILGNYQTALSYQFQELDICRLWGDNHPSIAQSYTTIALSYEKLGEHQESLLYLNKALTLQINIYGENHPDVAASYKNLGRVYKNLHNVKKEEECNQKAQHIILAIGGNNQTNIEVPSLNFDVHQRNTQQSEPFQKNGYPLSNTGNPCNKTAHTCVNDRKKQIKVQETQHDQQGPTINTQQESIEKQKKQALLYEAEGIKNKKNGNYQASIKCFERALDIYRKLSNDNNPKVAEIYKEMGVSYWILRNYQKSLENSQMSLRILRDLYGENHYDVILTYSNIGVIYGALGFNQTSQDFQLKALKGADLISNNSLTALCLNRMAVSCKSSGKIELANDYFRKAAEKYQEIGDGENAQKNLKEITEIRGHGIGGLIKRILKK